MPSGVHGHEPRGSRSPASRRCRVKAVHVLQRVDPLDDRAFVDLRGRGSCTRMPCTAGSAFSRSIFVEEVGLV